MAITADMHLIKSPYIYFNITFILHFHFADSESYEDEYANKNLFYKQWPFERMFNVNLFVLNVVFTCVKKCIFLSCSYLIRIKWNYYSDHMFHVILRRNNEPIQHKFTYPRSWRAYQQNFASGKFQREVVCRLRCLSIILPEK